MDHSFVIGKNPKKSYATDRPYSTKPYASLIL